MKRTKINFLIIMMALVMLFSLVACGANEETSSRSSRTSRNNEDVEDDNEEDSDEDESDDEDDVSSESIIYDGLSDYYSEEENQGSELTINYSFEIVDDESCIYHEEYVYGDGASRYYSYPGTYEESDNGYIATLYYGGYTETLSLTVDKDDMTLLSYSNDDSDCGEIVGVYTCMDRQYGEMVLEISSNGDASLALPKDIYTGDIFMFEGNWDLMVSNSDYSESFDWYITFKDDRFAYTPYAETLYGEYAGSYICHGDLGDFEINVTSMGDATAIINVDGQVNEYTGHLYAYDGVIEVSLEYGNIDIQLYLYEADGEYEYDGTLTKRTTLSVG